MNVRDIVAAEFAGRVKERIRETLAAGAATFETEYCTKDGRRIPTEINESPCVRKEGRMILSVARDITERKRAEEEIEKFKRICDEVDHGISINSPEGERIYVNEAFARMHGYTIDELIGHHFSDIYPAGDRVMIEARRRQNIETSPSVPRERQHWRKDGSSVPVLTSGFAVKDVKGKLMYTGAVVVDITEHKKTEEEIEKFKRICDEVEYGICINGSDGKRIYVNEAFARIHGYTVDELAGKYYLDMFLPDVRVELQARRRQNIEAGSLAPQERQHLRKDGSTVPVIASSIAVKDAKGI